ncbi:MAG: NAD(P)-dependent alcohol dehydrogenase [Mangrovibacterium sp.]
MKQVKAYGAPSATAPFKEMNIARREVMAQDVEFEVTYCGICHSDLHQLHDDFGGATFPLVPGHEIIGKDTSEVSDYKAGDYVAVGCIVDSCRHCPECEEGEEQFCHEGVTFSFNSADKVSGGVTYGGFSKSYVCDQKYILRMPQFENMAASAPLLCAGITVYSPLKHWGAAPGKQVGVLGIGGLGHLTIKIAKAMGAEVTVFTTSAGKVEDAKRLGADHAVLSTDADAMAAMTGKMHFIIDTVSAKHDVNMYLNTLKRDGSVVLVGLPPEALEIGAFNVVSGRKSFSGSNIGGIRETQEMLDFCHKHNIVAESEVIKIQDVNKALERLEKGDVKYRFVIDLESL